MNRINEGARNHFTAVQAHEPQHRGQVLLDLMRSPDRDKDELWPVVGQVYRRLDQDDVDIRVWSAIWTENGGDRRLAMTKEERGTCLNCSGELVALPSDVKIRTFRSVWVHREQDYRQWEYSACV